MVAPLILWATLPLSLSAQAPHSEKDLQLAVTYRRLVHDYQDGRREAVERAAAMPASELERILNVIFSAWVPEGPWTPRELEAAVVLHGDVALAPIKLAAETSNFHLHYGSVLLYKLGPGHRDLAVRWYVALAGMLRVRAQLAPAESLLENGRKWVPESAPILFESAVTAEMQASHAAMAGGAGTPLQRRTGWLNSADSWLRKAASLDSSDARTRLHLGRVQMLRGNHAAALKTFEPLDRSYDATAIRYLAALFAGAVYDRDGDDEGAARQYRKAMEIIPGAQTAHVAVAELLQRRGRLDDSRAELAGFLDGQQMDTDPWWFYFQEPWSQVEQRWLALRRGVQR